MLSTLEDQACNNFKSVNKQADMTLAQILQKIDIIYGPPTTFQDLNATLCGLKQGAFKLAKTYYEHMAMLVVMLQEHHGAQFQDGELDQMAKDCFYTGLR